MFGTIVACACKDLCLGGVGRVTSGDLGWLRFGPTTSRQGQERDTRRNVGVDESVKWTRSRPGREGTRVERGVKGASVPRSVRYLTVQRVPKQEVRRSGPVHGKGDGPGGRRAGLDGLESLRRADLPKELGSHLYHDGDSSLSRDREVCGEPDDTLVRYPCFTGPVRIVSHRQVHLERRQEGYINKIPK